MKIINQFIVYSVGLLLANSSLSHAEEFPDQVTGELKMEFSVKIDQAELEELARTYSTLERLDAYSVDFNDLVEPEDQKTLELAAHTLSKRVIRIGKRLANSAAITYKLRKLRKASEVYRGSFVKQIEKGRTKSLQASYSIILRQFLDLEEFEPVLGSCISEVCVSEVSQGLFEWIEIGRKLNLPIPAKGKYQHHHAKIQVRSNFLKLALSEAFVSLTRQNSIYAELVASMIVPFIKATEANQSVDIANDFLIRMGLKDGQHEFHLKRRLKRVPMRYFRQDRRAILKLGREEMLRVSQIDFLAPEEEKESE